MFSRHQRHFNWKAKIMSTYESSGAGEVYWKADNVNQKQGTLDYAFTGQLRRRRLDEISLLDGLDDETRLLPTVTDLDTEPGTHTLANVEDEETLDIGRNAESKEESPGPFSRFRHMVKRWGSIMMKAEVTDVDGPITPKDRINYGLILQATAHSATPSAQEKTRENGRLRDAKRQALAVGNVASKPAIQFVGGNPETKETLAAAQEALLDDGSDRSTLEEEVELLERLLGGLNRLYTVEEDATVRL